MSHLEKSRTSRALALSRPSQCKGNPTTQPPIWFSRVSCWKCLTSMAGALRWKVSRGLVQVRLGSHNEIPIRTVPKSIPASRPESGQGKS